MHDITWNEARAAAFARQLTLPQQRELLQRWNGLRRPGQRWPRREDIRARDLWPLLPNVLLMRLLPLPDGMEIHMAGSALWDIYGGELTGCTLRDPRLEAHVAQWREFCAASLGAPQPVNGHLMIERDEEGAAHAVLFWMRLPLVDADGETWMLGLDISLSASRFEGLLPPGGEDGHSGASSSAA